MFEKNKGVPLDLNVVNKVCLDKQLIEQQAEKFCKFEDFVKEPTRSSWLLKAITLTDLTSLGAADTDADIATLCKRALKPLQDDLMIALGLEDYNDGILPTASVCVFPVKVEVARRTLSLIDLTNKVKICSVAAGFPSGQYPLHTRLAEIKYAVEKGANEIDVVIDRSLAITGQWEVLYNELKQMKSACGPNVCMKTILATGELRSLENVYKASMVAMMAGSDFIKTSTGKEAVNATLINGIVMCNAISDYHQKYGFQVGLKPAGGLKVSEDVLSWLYLVKDMLGQDWLTTDLFRIGASSLVNNIERDLYNSIPDKNSS